MRPIPPPTYLCASLALTGFALAAQGPVAGPSAATSPSEPSLRSLDPALAAQAVPDVRDGGSPPPIDVAGDDLVPGAGDGETKADGSPWFLGFVAHDHYPPADERIDPLLLSQARIEPADGRPAPTSYAFVMFARRITAARLATLEALGCRVLGRHPHYTVKVALPPERIDAVAALDFVRWIGAPRATQKVHPSLARRVDATPAGETVEMYVSVYESDLNPESTREVVAMPIETGPGVEPAEGDPRHAATALRSDGWQHRALEAAGCEVGVYDDGRRTFRVRAPGAALEGLVALDFVQFVEEVPVSRTHHDDSTSMIMADSARWYANGNSYFPVTVGELDTGISTSHWDLAFHLNGVGWDVSGSGAGPWVDTCGHGTHVCGTIAGDGTADPAHRGVAPGLGTNGAVGRFFNAKIFASCANQAVDFAGAMSAMRSNYGSSPRPMVVNNSWGSSPSGGAWTGSEYDARILDDEVFWQQQMYVFSAGNDGPGAGTIGLQGGAKNAFTVGSVSDYRWGSSYPGDLSGFSSRGTMADSRWKPNVVAPGDWIRSIAANTSTSYTGLAGTSMAAPHVSGIAAQMGDIHSFYRWAPARMAATLMATAVPKDNTVITSHSNGHLETYGAGRVQAFHASHASNGATWVNWGFDLNAGQGTWADVYVYPGCSRLEVVMTWHEQAASAGASKAAINDWDLYIDQEPFAAGTNTGEFHAGLSSRNNTEIRFIENPAAGWYRWKVHPYDATTTGRFGITTALVYGSTTPSTTLQVGQSATYVTPGQDVTFDVTVSNPTWISSATHVLVDPVGGSVSAAWRTLGDGAYDDLSDNGNWIYECLLGDVLNGNSRGASFNARWFTDGWHNFDSSAYADNVGWRNTTNWVFVDGTPPAPPANVASPTHAPTAWSCSNQVEVAWDAAFDAGIGVAGYSYAFDQIGDTEPDAIVDTYGLAETFFAPDSLAVYYVHVRAVDWLGNASATVHGGPFSVMSAGHWQYCTSMHNSQFCLPAMSATGHLSATGADDLHLLADRIVNQKSGLLFWGFTPSSSPFQGGTKCVAQPVFRTGLLASGGSPSGGDCTGAFDFAFTRAYAASKGFTTPGSVAFAQFWYRDPQSQYGTGLTDATAIVLCE
jgi:hypothetical protein